MSRKIDSDWSVEISQGLESVESELDTTKRLNRLVELMDVRIDRYVNKKRKVRWRTVRQRCLSLKVSSKAIKDLWQSYDTTFRDRDYLWVEQYIDNLDKRQTTIDYLHELDDSIDEMRLKQIAIVKKLVLLQTTEANRFS